MVRIMKTNKPNKMALPPLLDEDKEKKRLESIERETERLKILDKKCRNINKILREGV